MIKAALQFVTLFLNFIDFLGSCELMLIFDAAELSFQFLNLHVLLTGSFLDSSFELRLSKLRCGFFGLLRLFEFVREFITLFFDPAYRLIHGEFLRDLTGIELSLQITYLRILGCNFLSNSLATLVFSSSTALFLSFSA